MRTLFALFVAGLVAASRHRLHITRSNRQPPGRPSGHDRPSIRRKRLTDPARTPNAHRSRRDGIAVLRHGPQDRLAEHGRRGRHEPRASDCHVDRYRPARRAGAGADPQRLPPVRPVSNTPL